MAKYNKIIILLIETFLLFHYAEINFSQLNDKNRINELNDITFINKNYSDGNKDKLNKQYINVSVIIPVYNCEKTINSSILSIQQQNLTNLEIILVNDLSQDNSLKIINEFLKNDSRIKLINNKQNHGTLYSRSIGALSAKGSYIFSLDNDDEFYGNDSFDYIFKQAIEKKYDIINFRRISVRNKKKLKVRLKYINKLNFNHSLTIHQPELSIYPISRNGKFFSNSFFLWDKCIKTDIYQKAIQMLGNEINSKNISYNEDIIIIFIIFSISNSMKIINKYGIIHYIYKTSTARTRSIEYKIYCDIYLLDILFRFSKNNSHKNLCVDYFLANRKFLSKTSSKEYNLTLIQILEKISKDLYITEKNKILLKQIVKNIELKLK